LNEFTSAFNRLDPIPRYEATEWGLTRYRATSLSVKERDTFQLFLQLAQKDFWKPPSKLAVADLNATLISDRFFGHHGNQ